MAIVDGEGLIYIRDRIKDMIISGGENISPAEIEHVILGQVGRVGVHTTKLQKLSLTYYTHNPH
jgi:acyl-CoA synthetase (AMP-forming)/AMP-acid ligase II